METIARVDPASDLDGRRWDPDLAAVPRGGAGSRLGASSIIISKEGRDVSSSEKPTDQGAEKDGKGGSGETGRGPGSGGPQAEGHRRGTGKPEATRLEEDRRDLRRRPDV